MIDVVVFHADGRKDTAEADSPENALYAARTLCDESFRGRQGSKPSVGFYVDDKLVRLVEGRP